MGVENKSEYDVRREVAERDKSLQIAMALKRYARATPNTKLGDGGYLSSRNIQSALETNGIEISVNDPIDSEDFERIDAKVNSMGFDKSLKITKISDGHFLVKIKT